MVSIESWTNPGRTCHTVDPDRYVRSGDSAGGYLCTQVAFELNPPPSAVVPVYALVDFYDSAMKNRGTHSATAPEYHRPRTEEELSATANDYDLSHADVFCPWDGDRTPSLQIEQTQIFLGVPDYEVTDRHLLRLDLNKYVHSVVYDRLAALFRRKPETTMKTSRNRSNLGHRSSSSTMSRTILPHSSCMEAEIVSCQYRSPIRWPRSSKL